ncbi:MAG TPA: LLM class flavin-dependent oxidoreductase [Candidatus Dormibacteraeota bacterium]|nr:LLM class flavin-dependent oxidoreductase [Candidatus Dormibacteraeota bacterium]
MAQIGVMIEAQEGLNWERWRRVVRDAERLGFASLRTSDHCWSVFGVEGRESLSAWPALTAAAAWTERIQIGPMVSPITFYVPAVLGRMARAVDELSGGRLILGLGTGWNQAEHERFGIPFPSWRRRFDALEAGIERVRQTFGERPIPLLIGGGGERRTIPLAARVASEWNLNLGDPDDFRARSALLDQHCRAIGRDPAQIRRSVMRPYLIGRDPEELGRRAARLAEVIPGLRDLPPGDVLRALRERGALVGTPQEVIELMRPLAEAGAELFMLQHFLLDDPDHLELLASEVLPAVAEMRPAA